MAIAQPNNRPEPCVLVIFGASGDLTSRKLVPALYELFRAGRLPEPFAVMGVARTKMSDDEWRAKLREWASQHMGGEGFDPASWAEFEKIVHYQPASATEADAYPVLIARINALASEHGMCRDTADELPTWAQQPNVLFYLSVAPHLYEPIISQIGESGMVFEGKRWCAIGEDKMPWQRIIVEKPFGEDLESARALNRSISRVFNEDMIYRIDHYLGKELVQNILVMRFANSIFEPLWSNAHIDHVQVTAAEKVGVGQRAGNFYDRAGATKDMIQSHLLQVLALVAMEAPNSYDPDAIRAMSLDGRLATDLDGIVMKEFCSGPPVEFTVHEKEQNAVYMLEWNGEIGIQSKRDIVLAELRPAGPRTHRSADDPKPKSSVTFEITTPSRRLVRDVILHRDVFPSWIPEVRVFETGEAGSVDPNDATRVVDEFNVKETAELLGYSMNKFQTADVPNYVDMLLHVCDKLGWNPDDFRCVRTETDYPIFSSHYVHVFDPLVIDDE